MAPSVSNRIDLGKRHPLVVELDEGGGAVEEARCDGDGLSGEIAERDLVRHPFHADGAVAAHAATDAHGERGPQLCLGDALRFALGEHHGRGATEQPAVRGALIEA